MFFSESCIAVDARSSDHLDDFAVAFGLCVSFWAMCYVITNDAFPMRPKKGGRIVPRRWVVPKRTDEYASRIMSTLHAVASTGLCGWAVYRHMLLGNDLSAQPATCVDAVILAVSVGYFAVDFVGIIVGSYYDFTYLMHHFWTITGILIVVFRDQLGFHMVALVMWMELSNPAMHLRWLLQEDGKDHIADWRMRFLSWNFLVLFGFARFVAGPYLWLVSMGVDDYPWVNKAIGFIMFVVSANVWIKAIRGQFRGESWVC